LIGKVKTVYYFWYQIMTITKANTWFYFSYYFKNSTGGFC